jgi:hypothetical protein
MSMILGVRRRWLAELGTSGRLTEWIGLHWLRGTMAALLKTRVGLSCFSGLLYCLHRQGRCAGMRDH